MRRPSRNTVSVPLDDTTKTTASGASAENRCAEVCRVPRCAGMRRCTSGVVHRWTPTVVTQPLAVDQRGTVELRERVEHRREVLAVGHVQRRDGDGHGEPEVPELVGVAGRVPHDRRPDAAGAEPVRGQLEDVGQQHRIVLVELGGDRLHEPAAHRLGAPLDAVPHRHAATASTGAPSRAPGAGRSARRAPSPGAPRTTRTPASARSTPAGPGRPPCARGTTSVRRPAGARRRGRRGRCRCRSPPVLAVVPAVGSRVRMIAP